MAQIEIEYRALLTEDAYNALAKKLDGEAKDLGEDDKDVFFFIFPDKLLKVVNNMSAKSAKIVLKLNKIGVGSDFEEIEIPISQSDVDKSVRAFKAMGFTEVQQSFQKRHNYIYKDVELALKYSDNWGYHIELELLVDNVAKKDDADKQIYAVANELGLKIMTDEELAEFTKKIDAQHRAKRAK